MTPPIDHERRGRSGSGSARSARADRGALRERPAAAGRGVRRSCSDIESPLPFAAASTACSSTPPANSATVRPSRSTTMRSQRPISSGISLEATRMPSPCAGQLRAAARRSRPWRRRRRRASARRAGGGAGSPRTSLASTTFCWLPPESAPTAIVGLARPDVELAERLVDRSASRAPSTSSRTARCAGCTDMTRLRPTAMRSIRPLPRRSSVTKATPARRAAAIEFSSRRACRRSRPSPCQRPGRPVP